MRELDLVIRNKTGLHARPAKEFVTLVSGFASDIQIGHAGKTVNAKSLISVLTLAVRSGGSVQITIEGQDEEQAAEAIREAILNGLGEGEQASSEEIAEQDES